MIKLCAFADEASASLEGQISALKRNDIGYIELRGINGKNISKITEEEAIEYKKELDLSGISVWSIGSPIGKIKITDDLDAHVELLRHVCRLANIFECDKVRMFSFYSAYDEPQLVFDTLRRMVEVAGEYGVKLYHENEKEIYGDTLTRVLELIEKVPGMYFIYDPANFIESGEDPELTVPRLFSHMGYFHIKDCDRSTRAILPAGYGDGRIPEIVSKIETDTVLSIEPHLVVFDGYSQFDDTKMQNVMCYKTNDEAFDAAVAAIKSVLVGRGYREVNGEFVK